MEHKNRRHKNFWMRYSIEDIISLGLGGSVPQRRLVYGFFAYIAIGTLLLLLPVATYVHRPLIDHFFTAVSGITTTGLSTVDIAGTYRLFGQIVLLLLIQVGGVGYMTISTFFFFRMTRHFMDKKSKLMSIQFTMPVEMELRELISGIIYFTISIELIGALLLYPCFVHHGVLRPAWQAIFHAVSAFCTAGFTTLPGGGLIPYRGDVPLNLILSFLSILGAMGFIFMTDVLNRLTGKRKRLTFTTRNIIVVTFSVIALGTLYLTLFDRTLAHARGLDSLLTAFFHVTSAMSTAGFNTVDLGASASPAALFILIMAMLAGASPSGTGGGLKSTTLTAVFAFVKSKFGKRRHTYLLGHRIPSYRVENALTTFITYVLLLFFGTFALVALTPELGNITPIRIFFEAVSAIGTVGLSTGITAEFGTIGKLILCLLMFCGRIGMIGIGQAMLLRMHHAVHSTATPEDLAV